MKTTSLFLLSSVTANSLDRPLVYESFDKNDVKDVLPTITGSPATAVDNTTTSCVACIRGGWVWCASKWHYEEPSANNYNAASDNGKCCYDATTKDVTIAGTDNTKKNTDKCPAMFTNDSGAAIVAATSKWWCSDATAFSFTTDTTTAKRMEIALANCRQKKKTC